MPQLTIPNIDDRTLERLPPAGRGSRSTGRSRSQCYSGRSVKNGFRRSMGGGKRHARGVGDSGREFPDSTPLIREDGVDERLCRFSLYNVGRSSKATNPLTRRRREWDWMQRSSVPTVARLAMLPRFNRHLCKPFRESFLVACQVAWRRFRRQPSAALFSLTLSVATWSPLRQNRRATTRDRNSLHSSDLGHRTLFSK